MVSCAPKAGTKAHFNAVNHTGLIMTIKTKLEGPPMLSIEEAKTWWQEICARLHPYRRGKWQETIIDR